MILAPPCGGDKSPGLDLEKRRLKKRWRQRWNGAKYR